MKSLNKTQLNDIEQHGAKLEDARRIIEEAISKAQAIIDRALAEVDELREEAAETMREIYGNAEDYVSERSDAWREGETGERYSEWMNALDEAANTLETGFDIQLADLVELDELDGFVEALTDIPEAPEQ